MRAKVAGRTDGGGGPAPVRALSRGLFILSQFTAVDPGLSLSELARRTGLHRATVYRFVKTLQAEGFLILDPDEGVYRVGPAWAAALYALGGDSILLEVMRNDLMMLAKSTGEGVTLSLRRGDQVQLMHVVADSTAYAPTVPTSSFVPLNEHSVVQARIHLAYADADTQKRMLAIPAARHTDMTVTDPAQIKARLLETARERLALCREEYKKGLCAIAVPVFVRGELVAGLGLLTPLERFDDDHVGRYSAELQSAATTIGERMGQGRSHLARHA